MNEKIDVHIFVWPAIQCARPFFFYSYLKETKKKSTINSKNKEFARKNDAKESCLICGI